MKHVVALFGEAEKGQFKTPYYLRELAQLMDLLGNCPNDSDGVFFAIQSLLYNREVIYFRVAEEGFSKTDYFQGFRQLEEAQKLHAVCLPGVGDTEILHASHALCHKHRSFLITTQKDLFDYLTSC
ncbi:MAG: hypothetical protein HY069_02810 [Chlamydiia bacterium]|nr:hypothetical protein [Chlamydiia bacterium]